MDLFDAAIELDVLSVPPGMEPASTVSTVLAAVLAIPGAGRISVRCGDRSIARTRVRVSQADDRFTLDSAACLRIAALVEAEVRRTLFPALAPVRH